MIKKMTAISAIKSLRSTLCPHCGGVKKSMQTLCSKDYCELTPEMRRALYIQVGHGYEQAVADALNYLAMPAGTK